MLQTSPCLFVHIDYPLPPLQVCLGISGVFPATAECIFDGTLQFTFQRTKFRGNHGDTHMRNRHFHVWSFWIHVPITFTLPLRPQVLYAELNKVVARSHAWGVCKRIWPHAPDTEPSPFSATASSAACRAFSASITGTGGVASLSLGPVIRSSTSQMSDAIPEKSSKSHLLKRSTASSRAQCGRLGEMIPIDHFLPYQWFFRTDLSAMFHCLFCKFESRLELMEGCKNTHCKVAVGFTCVKTSSCRKLHCGTMWQLQAFKGTLHISPLASVSAVQPLSPCFLLVCLCILWQ